MGLAGLALFFTGDTSNFGSAALPLDGPRRQSFLGLQFYQVAGELSAYDAFRFSARRQQAVAGTAS